MAENRGPWREGQLTWSRLEDWYLDASQARADGADSDSDDSERALQALEDSGLVRRLLDQVEFEAVRTARRNGRSWAEIAVKLGVTRQSAWERWRDVDEQASGTQPALEDTRGPADMADVADVPELSKRKAREWRRRSTIVVPNVVGMASDIARKTLHEKDLIAAAADPDGRPFGPLDWPDGVVIDQSPEAGAKVPLGSVVRLWIERNGGGGSGVREPRRPMPDPMSGREARLDDAVDEVVGRAVGRVMGRVVGVERAAGSA